MKIIQFLFLGFVISHSANAHHGFATHYDIDSPVRLEGVLTKVDLRNPHSFIYVSIENNGESEEWYCETQARSLLVRKGITAEQFTIGDRVVLEGSLARREANHCEANSIELADGSSLTFRSPEGRANIGDIANARAESEQANSILGAWIRTSFAGPPYNRETLENLTDAGKEANVPYDSAVDDPSNECYSANPMRAWLAPGTPLKMSRQGDNILIHHEFMDTQRIVYLHEDPEQQLSQPLSEDYVPTVMGIAYGKLSEDESELTIYSAGFEPGVLLTQVGPSGVLFSNKMVMTEVVKLGETNEDLSYQWQAYDSDYFPKGINGEFHLKHVDTEIGQYDCQLTNEH